MRLLLLVLGLLLTGPVAAESARPLVMASIEPLAMMLREVLGDSAEVRTLMLPNQSEHHSSFTPAQARLVREADLLVWLGAEAEPALAALVRRHGRRQLALSALEGVHWRGGDGHHHHHADQDHADDHGLGLDPHVWLWPDNMVRLAAGLSQHAALFPELELAPRQQQFAAQVERETSAARTLLAPLAAVPYLSQHNPWGYYAEAMGLRQPLVVSEQLEDALGAQRFARLSAEVREARVRCILAEPEARLALLQRLCPQCTVQPLDPVARTRTTIVYSDFLRETATTFAQCLRQR